MQRRTTMAADQHRTGEPKATDDLPCCFACCRTPGCPGCDTLRERVDALEAGIRSLIEHHDREADAEAIRSRAKDNGHDFCVRMKGRSEVRRFLVARLHNLLDGSLLIPKPAPSVSDEEWLPCRGG